MCLFIIVGDFMSAFWYACVTSVDLWMCECMRMVIMIEASKLSASQTPWSIRACGIAVQPPVPSTRALTLRQHSQCPSLGTGSKSSLSLSVSIFHIDLNDYNTLTTAAPLGEITSAFTSTQTVSLHTQTHAPRSTPLKPALDSQELTLTM